MLFRNNACLNKKNQNNVAIIKWKVTIVYMDFSSHNRIFKKSAIISVLKKVIYQQIPVKSFQETIGPTPNSHYVMVFPIIYPIQ